MHPWFPKFGETITLRSSRQKSPTPSDRPSRPAPAIGRPPEPGHSAIRLRAWLAFMIPGMGNPEFAIEISQIEPLENS